MDLDLKDISMTEKNVLDILNEFKRNQISKVNVNISDSDKAKDKFARIELGKLFRICCFKGAGIQVLQKHLDIFESDPFQLFML